MQVVHHLPRNRGRRLAADPTARLRRVQALAANRTACAELLVAIDDPSLQVGRAALKRLAVLGGADEGVLLAGRLLDVDIGLVPDFARAVARLDRPAAARVAVEGLRSPAAHVRQAAAIALVELAWPDGRAELERLLADEAGFVRRAAVDALARLTASPGTLALLVERLADPDVGVRVAAIAAVARLSESPCEGLRHALEDPDARVRLALAKHAAQLESLLLKRLLDDPDEDVRVEVLWRLLEAPRAELTPAIRDRLHDREARVRRAACRALAPLRDPVADADDALVERLADSESLVRAAALRALRERRPADAAGFLAGRLVRVDPWLRPALLYAIARLDAATADACVGRLDLVHDPSPDVRMAAAHCCLPESRDVLAALARDPDVGIRHAARIRLARDD
jgi:hypothetical protein